MANIETRETLEKKTKAEILDYFYHLGDTVQEKENEVNKFKSIQIDDRKKIELLEKDKSNLLETIKDLKNKIDNYKGKEREEKIEVEPVQRLLDRRVKELIDRRNLVDNFLKSFQGTLDMAVDLHSLYVKEEDK